jgi:hypothetical protein
MSIRCSDSYSIVDRPLLFSLALLPYITVLLERLRALLRDPQVSRRAVGAALGRVLGLVYLGTLLHRGTLVAYVVLGGYALDALGAWLLPPALAGRLLGGPVRRDVALLTTAAAVACGLAFFKTGVSGTLMPFLREHVTEWRQLPPAQLVVEFPGVAALLALALAAWSFLRFARQRSDLSVLHPALLVLFSVLACTWVRLVPPLAMLAAALLLG